MTFWTFGRGLREAARNENFPISANIPSRSAGEKIESEEIPMENSQAPPEGKENDLHSVKEREDVGSHTTLEGKLRPASQG